jgi:hypothetical protein
MDRIFNLTNNILNENNFDKESMEQPKTELDIENKVIIANPSKKNLWFGGWEVESESESESDSDKELIIEESYTGEINHEMYLTNLLFNLTVEKNNLDTNTSELYKYNPCYCCKNYIIIHQDNEFNFINKYYIPNKLNKKYNYSTSKSSSKNIKILFRLRPELFDDLNLKYYKYLDGLIPYRFSSSQDMMFQFEILFYSKNNEDSELNYYSYDTVSCLICEKKFCQTHMDFNPFYFKKCTLCSKSWCICSWCKYDKLYPYFTNEELTNIDILCKFFH